MSPITLPLDYVEVTLWACGDQSAVGEGETRMATGKAEGKSGFLQEYLVKHPDTAKEAIDAAWQKAGHEGTISTSLISKVRRDLAQSVKGAPKKSWPREAKEERPAAEAKASRNPVTASPAAPEASVSARAGALMRLEGA